MKINVGKADRAVRIVLGLAIIGAGLYYQSLWGLIGLVPIATGLSRRCPSYLPFNISTIGKDEKTE